MRGTAAKDFRRQANKVAAQTLETMRPPVEAALRNEQVTRLRVDALEKTAAAIKETLGWPGVGSATDECRIVSRVEALEKLVDALKALYYKDIAALSQRIEATHAWHLRFESRTFRERLRWLLLGR